MKKIINKKQYQNNFLIAYEFFCYCRTHPELRFWQALSAWSGFEIQVGRGMWLVDPFYWTKKDEFNKTVDEE